MEYTDFCDESNDQCARYSALSSDSLRYEEPVETCLYDVKAQELVAFKCPEAAKCAMNNYPDQYYWRGGLCRDTTPVDECRLGDMRASKIRYDRKGSGCAKICKCVENPRDSSKGNIWVCDTVERQYTNLKVRCPSRLGSCASVARMSYSYCPYGDDSDDTDTTDICDPLSCNTDDDQTDEEVETDVCRRSNTGFTTTITKRDDTVGCKVE